MLATSGSWTAARSRALAKLSLARMITATVLRMGEDEEEYEPSRAGLLTTTRKG
jgi:hypothetical protein